MERAGSVIASWKVIAAAALSLCGGCGGAGVVGGTDDIGTDDAMTSDGGEKVDFPVSLDASGGATGDLARSPDLAGCPSGAMCFPGSTRTIGCAEANCGVETDICASNCQWVPGTCVAQGVCSPGSNQTKDCGNCGTETWTCAFDCTWAKGTCAAKVPTRKVNCAKCGSQTDTCSCSGPACNWVAGACTGQGACSPGDANTTGCNACTQQACLNNCQWDGVCRVKPTNDCDVGWKRGCINYACSSTGYSCCVNCKWSACGCSPCGL